MQEVKFSIVITCYNQASFIKDAVQSALAQTHPTKEVIVVDDGSSDDSVSILKEFEPAIRLIVLPKNCGASTARNRGAEVATGTYLLFLDGDDLLTPWALDVYEELTSDSHPTAILSGSLWFEGKIPSVQADIPNHIEFFRYPTLMAKDRGYGINIGAFVIEHSAFEKVGGWTPEIFQLDGQDLYAKLAYSGVAIVVHSPYTMLYRMHGGNSIRSVPPFLKSAHLMIRREQQGLYPGGPTKRFERYARHGGVIVFCIRKALRARLYTDALLLALRGWSMIFAAIIRKLLNLARPRYRLRVLKVHLQCNEQLVSQSDSGQLFQNTGVCGLE